MFRANKCFQVVGLHSGSGSRRLSRFPVEGSWMSTWVGLVHFAGRVVLRVVETEWQRLSTTYNSNCIATTVTFTANLRHGKITQPLGFLGETRVFELVLDGEP